MKIIAIILGKMFLNIGKIFKKGSSLPGMVALRIDRKLLSKLVYPKVKIIVTGSSGKGSTSGLIAFTLRDNGYSVCYNKTGANLSYGVMTSLLKDMNLLGKIKTDYLVLEVDERYTKVLFKDIKPDYVVITNLTKDQPPRQFNVDVVLDDVLNALNKKMTVITNMDDPYMRNLEKVWTKKMVYFGLDENKYSYKEQIFENLNIYYCPKCEGKLEYFYYNFEALGKYKCLDCDLEHQEPFVVGTDLDLEKETINVNKQEMFIGGDMLYNAYNSLAAYTALRVLGISPVKIISSINLVNGKKELKRNVRAISCKAENATTYNQAVFRVSLDKKKKDVVIGWKEISRRYKHYDVSWLYDVRFELLKDNNVNRFYACGIDKENIKKRLVLAGISEDKIVMADSLDEIKDLVYEDDVDYLYGILNFDYVESFLDVFEEGL